MSRQEERRAAGTGITSKLPRGLQGLARLATLNTRVDNAIGNLGTLRARLDDNAKRLRTLGKQVQRQNTRMADVSGAISGQGKRLEEIETRMGKNHADVAGATNQQDPSLDAIMQELKTLRARLEGLEAAITPPLPSLQEIRLVIGVEDPALFLRSGKMCAQVIRDVLHDNGLDIEDLGSMLDFGCGIGRIMRHWDTLEKTDLHGSDYNPDLIAWCKDNLTFAEFRVNSLEGRLEYEDERFDFIYAWSVFTHLTESQHFHWIQELSRVLRPGGHLFITTHGESYLERYSELYRQHLLETNQEDHLQRLIDTHGEEWFRQYNPLSQEQRESFRAGRLVVLGEDTAGSNECHAFHTEQYVRETLAKRLSVADFVSGGAESYYQDVYLLRKP